MKRVLALLCAFVLVISGLVQVTASAESILANSLYTRISPTTGKVFDLKGQTVYIYDFWTGYDWHEIVPETEEETILYNYRRWLEKTYNCKIMQTARGDWGTVIDELRKVAQSSKGMPCVFIIPPSFVNQAVTDNLLADWKKSASISLSDSKWNQSTISMMSYAGHVFGVSTGRTEPRQCLYFNKRVLEEAGIDWNNIYDLQKSGKWTWDAFTALLKKVQRDGIYGMTGNSDDLYRIAVFSNGGSFFDLSSTGEMTTTVKSEQSKEALAWAKNVWATWAAPQPDGSDWDWYKEYWKQGTTGFYMGQTYQGFNSYSEMEDMADPWGCVAFPKGPKGKGYVTIAEDNLTVIPASCTKEQINQASLIYDLWTNPAPELEEEEEEQEEKRLAEFEGKTDERAIYETYKMLTEEDHSKWDRTLLLGSINDILGAELLWYLSDEDLDALIERASDSWEAYLAAFNELIAKLEKESASTSLTSGGLVYELDKKDKTAQVTGATKKNISTLNVPATVKKGNKTYKVTSIAEGAFKGYSRLTSVNLGKNVRAINKSAFSNCTKLKTVSGGSGLYIIGDYAFRACTVLASFTLGKYVASIGDEAFYNCKKLKKMIVITTKLKDEVIGKKAFGSLYKTVSFECPKKKLKAYKELFKTKGAPKKATFKVLTN